MRRLDLALHGRQRGIDQKICQMSEGTAGILAGNRSGQQSDADEKPLFSGKDAQPVEPVFIMT
ncbi:hypothetical protein D3C80_541240 [compost metagenome]